MEAHVRGGDGPQTTGSPSQTARKPRGVRRDGAGCHADAPPLAKKITRSAAMTYMAQTEALWKRLRRHLLRNK